MNWLFTDIDITLIYSKRSLPFEYKDSSSVTFQRESDTSRQLLLPNGYKELFERIVGDDGKYIAVTARSLIEFNKIDLPFNWAYKVTNFGSFIYDNNDTLIKSFATQKTSDCISEFYLNSKDKHNAETNLVIENNLAIQIHFKFTSGSEAKFHLKLLEDYISLLNSPLTINCNKSIINIYHPACDKGYAVEYLNNVIIKNQDKKAFTIGAGDSNTDINFMQMCNYCITPSNSQILNTTSKEEN
jgi:hydroxymethylpyrimidine pyrophosphatase-like HAD family hydrolase